MSDNERTVAEILADDDLWGFIDPHGAKAARIRAALADPETRREATESAARVEVAPGATEDTNGAQGGAPGTDNETPAGGTESA